MTGLVTTRPELTGSFGMVASTHWIASQVGMSVLERGGNAADAAVAVGFTLQVVEPHLNGPGGEAPVIVADPDGLVHVVGGQGVVPASATPAAFAALGLDAIPGSGLLAATVPGAFGAWLVVLQRWGTWRLRDVLEPAIAYARSGFPVIPQVSAAIEAARGGLARWPSSLDTYTAGGVPPAPWSRLRLPALGATYERVLAQAESVGADRDRQIMAARDAWYRGFVAEAIGAFCAGDPVPDAEGRADRGLLTADDLAAWAPTVEPAVRFAYRGVEVCKPGPWTQGPVLLQQLALLAAAGVADASLDLADPALIHLIVEAQKLAFADREAWYGDPAIVDVPLEDLLSPDYCAARVAGIDAGRAHGDLLPGSPGGRAPVLPELTEYDETGRRRPAVPSEGADLLDPVDGEPLAPEWRGDTCHLDVADRWGMLIAATPSGGWLQSSPVIPALGFPLGTRAQMARLAPGLPSSLRPWTRPRTTLSPTLMLRDGLPWIALGTPGGDQQDQWSLLFVLRILHAEGRIALQAAIDAPMLHTEHAPSSFHPRRARPGLVVAESRWPAAVTEGLARRGHDVVLVDAWSLGRLSAVGRERAADGTIWLRAAANPRGAQGYAVGR